MIATIKKELNSKQNLSVDVSTVDLPKGSGGPHHRITKIKGKNNSLQLKTSIVTIENNDQLCLARAFGVSLAKLKRCTPEEWKEVTENRGIKTNLQLVLQHKKVPMTYYNDLVNKNRKQQGQLAATLCQMAGVSMDRPASLNSIEAFEEVLGMRVMVVSARLGNEFITSPSSDERPCSRR